MVTNDWKWGTFIIVLSVLLLLGVLFLTSSANTPLWIKSFPLEMKLEQIKMEPLPLDIN